MSVRYGLKLWSQNLHYIPCAQRLAREGVFDFIELYVDLKASAQQRDAWAQAGIPIRLHAPHSYGGFNPAIPGQEDVKRGVLEVVDGYRHVLKPASIIFHPGLDGSIDTSRSHFSWLKNEFPEVFDIAVIENKPMMGFKEEFCCGAPPAEIKGLMEAIGFRFCLDFGHAICYANWAGLAWDDVIDDFMRLTPALFHISDGDIRSVRDQHLHFGEGDYDLEAIMARVPSDGLVTIETRHDSKEHLDDFRKDVDYLKRLERKLGK